MNIKKLTNSNFKSILDEAVDLIKSGGIVIAPFDTVYGIICDPRNNTALEKIFALKQRPLDKTIGLAVDSVVTLELLTLPKHPKIPNNPNFLSNTLILPAKPNNLSKYCQKNGTVAARIPDSKLILAIVKATGGVIAQTSTNLSGRPACSSIAEIESQFSPEALESVDLIIDWGQIKNSKPSQIFDLTGDQPVKIAR